MKSNAKDFFENVSQFCYVHKSPYSLSTQNDAISEDSYERGILKVYNWVDELCYFYLQKESQMKKEFIFEIKKRLSEINELKDSPYKEGAFEAFDTILTFLKNC